MGVWGRCVWMHEGKWGVLRPHHSGSDCEALTITSPKDMGSSRVCRGLKPVPQPLRTRLSLGVALDLISHDFHVCEPLLI